MIRFLKGQHVICLTEGMLADYDKSKKKARRRINPEKLECGWLFMSYDRDRHIADDFESPLQGSRRRSRGTSCGSDGRGLGLGDVVGSGGGGDEGCSASLICVSFLSFEIYVVRDAKRCERDFPSLCA